MGAIEIITLNTYYDKITFVKGGEYYEKDNHGKKVYYTIRDRVVQAL